MNGTGSPFGKPCCVLGMSVGEEDRRRRDFADPAEPVCSAIDHDTGAGLLNE